MTVLLALVAGCATVPDGARVEVRPAGEGRCTRVVVGVDRAPSETRGALEDCELVAEFALAPSGVLSLPILPTHGPRKPAVGFASGATGVVGASLVLPELRPSGTPWSVRVPLPIDDPAHVDLGAWWPLAIELRAGTRGGGSERFVIGPLDDAEAELKADPRYCTRGLARLAFLPASPGLVTEREDWTTGRLPDTPLWCSGDNEGVLGLVLPRPPAEGLDVLVEVRGSPPRIFRLRPGDQDNHTQLEVLLEHPGG